MRVLSSGFSVVAPGWRSRLTPAAVVLVLGVGFLAAHLPFVAPGPSSIDATNFALAVRDFNLSDHRPHPPGYPVYVALGKIARPLAAAGRDADTVRDEARALGMWSALFGAFAVMPLFAIFRSLDGDSRTAAAATVLAVMCPLFWFLAIRPMSDVPGLGAALIAQAIVFAAYRRQERLEWRDARRLLLVGGIVSGLAVGLRSQTVWLTFPLLAAVTFRQFNAHDERPARALAGLATFAAGVVVWAVPLVAASGGLHSYVTTLDVQAGEDFGDVDMLVRNPTPARLAVGLATTFAYPWANKYLALVVLLLAAAGFVAMLVRSRRPLGWLLLTAGPYTVFHLLYQDPEFTRYALPVVPVVAYLAVRGLRIVSAQRLSWLVAPVAGACLAVAGSPVLLHATMGGPALQAASAVRAALDRDRTNRPMLAAHHEVGRALRGERFAAGQLAFPRRHEWLEAVKYWRNGGTAPVWFLADSSRTDLALVDAAAQRRRGKFRFPFNNRFFMSGARPTGVDWVELEDPGWMAGEGWALTPETAGVAWRDGRGPADRPISAWIRRRPDAAVLMIGGRNLEECGVSPVRFDVTLDGRPLASWDVAPGFFLETVPLPAGALEGTGRYAELRVAARPADGVIRRAIAAVEQFDVQSADRPVVGYGAGWHHREFDPEAKRMWRWTGPWAALRVHTGGRARTLRITGDSPLKYLNQPPNLVIRAGERVLGRFTPGDDFVLRVDVPADAVAQAGGSLVLETDATFVPDERLHNGDRRLLGLRIFDVSIN